MRLRLPLALTILCLLSRTLSGQNLDFGLAHSSGESRGKAGAGIATGGGMSSVNLNPAGLATTSCRCFSFSQSIPYYGYHLYRKNEGVGAINFDWRSVRYVIDHFLFAFPIRKNLVIGTGYIKRATIFQNNKRRAITWSSLFNQDTFGSLNALVLSTCFSPSPNLALGVTLYRHFGKVKSEITGENHGNDADKWASLESRFKGYNYRIGAVLGSGKLSLGLVFEPSRELEIDVMKGISADGLYQNLLPDYDRIDWETPVILAAGIAYTGPKNILLTIDVERRLYEESELQLNLFEFGGRPNWKDTNIVRVGVECFPFANKSLPLRFGYARIPQLYASNTSTGMGNSIVEYTDTNQNIKHLFAVGTTLVFSKAIFSANLEYTRLDWHRDLVTAWLITDIYEERTFAITLDIVYPF